MTQTLRTLAITFGLLLSSLALADAARSLQKEGTQLRLQGDFTAADTIESQLLAEHEEPIGSIFALNSIVTHLTWDETQTQYDESLRYHADKTLAWCSTRLTAENDKDTQTLAHYYCGQANFALAYHFGLRGSYYQAGRRGTRSIEHLEAALSLNPNLTDAKMHLGVAYHVADNLPPFIKMFSRFLWFIPTGNSEKSLPYLHEVTQSGDIYKDVARYIYAITLLDEPDRQDEGVEHLRYLVEHYPYNPRFQLRLISQLLIDDEFDATIETAHRYLNSAQPPTEPELSLTKIWMVRAHMGLRDAEMAQALFTEIDPLFEAAKDMLPGWSVSWHMLTEAQLNDLGQRRAEAKLIYEQILDIAKTTYVSDVIQEAAQMGLQTPYKLR